jgi:uncharacterized repeat protein (TIGR01451 family)
MNTLQCRDSMDSNASFAPLCGALLALWLAPIAAAEEVVDPLAIKAIAEVEFRSREGAQEAVKLIPADRVVPGDRVIYTLEVRNTAATELAAPTVTHPVPDHMRYIANSAVGPGAEVSYSVDGGHSFGRAEDLKVPGLDGRLRPAVAADYTHIRWQLKNSLRANSVAFVRFRALVK